MLYFYSSNFRVTEIMHYKNYEKSWFKLEGTHAITLFRVGEYGGIELPSIAWQKKDMNMTWNNQGAPTYKDIFVKVKARFMFGGLHKDLYVSVFSLIVLVDWCVDFGHTYS